MIVAGIDPGKSGALFLYDPDCGAHACVGVPLFNDAKGKSKADYALWAAQWVPILKQTRHVFIERVGAMPGQGVSSMFTFGYTAGFAYGLVVGLELPHTFLTPQAWKKAVGLKGSDGEQSRRRASQLLPACVTLWPRKADDGRAEAALIAYAGLNCVEGKTTDG